MSAKLKQISSDRLLWLLASFICLSFIILFIILQLNNRINTLDDFTFIRRMHEMGFWESLFEWRYNQRPVSYFLFNLTFVFNERIETLRWPLLIAHLSFLFLFIHSTCLVIKKIFKKLTVELSSKKVWILATLLVICAFYFSFSRIEVWFWYLCMIIYLLPFVFINYGFVFLLSNSSRKWISILFFILIGGTLELFIPIVGCLLLFFYLNRKISLTSLFINGLSLLFFSFFQLLNKGIENRIKLEKPDFESHTSTFYSTFGHLFEFKNVFFLLLLLLIITLLQKELKGLIQFNFSNLLKQLLILLGLYFFITWFLGYLVFSGSFGLLRMWAPFSLFLMIFIILLMINVARRISINQWIGVGGAICYLLLFSIFSYKQIKLTTMYAKEYDEILKDPKNKEIKVIDSGILVSSGDTKLLLDNLTVFENE